MFWFKGIDLLVLGMSNGGCPLKKADVLMAQGGMRDFFILEERGARKGYAGIKKKRVNYYPFGMLMPGRHYSNGDLNYRYGFGGEENENELKGVGLTVAYVERMYDPRLGRWFSTDNKENWYPAYSTYSFAANSPIFIVDENGEFLGTIIGAVIGATVNGVVAAVKGDNVWKAMGRGAISGAIGGAVFDAAVAIIATGGAATPGVLAVAGALSGAAANTSDQIMAINAGEQEDFDALELGISTGLGAGLGYLGGKLGPPLARGARRLFGKAASQAAAEAGVAIESGVPTSTGIGDDLAQVGDDLAQVGGDVAKNVNKGKFAFQEIYKVGDDAFHSMTKLNNGSVVEVSGDLVPQGKHLNFNDVSVFQQSTKPAKELGNTVGTRNTIEIRNSLLRWAKDQGFKTAAFDGFRMEGSAANPGVTQGANKIYNLADF